MVYYYSTWKVVSKTIPLKQTNTLTSIDLLEIDFFSHFRNTNKLCYWDGVNQDFNNKMVMRQILFYTCKTRTGTLGACAHVTVTIWYLDTLNHRPGRIC